MELELFVRRSALVAVAILMVAPASANAAGVQAMAAHVTGTRALVGASDPRLTLFPSDLFTVRDRAQLTGRRIHLPIPDCVAAASDCLEIDLLNKLDGFNLQPRIDLPFSGPIDPATVTSANLFMVLLNEEGSEHGRRQPREVVGINQVIWDPATNTLHAKADQHLRQQSRYLLIATNGIRDAAGDQVERAIESRPRRDEAREDEDDTLEAYRDRLREAVDRIEELGIRRRDVVAASIFTTQSITYFLEKVRDQAIAAPTSPATFEITIDAQRQPIPNVRAVFEMDDVSSVLSLAETRVNPTILSSAPVTLDAARQMSEGTLGVVAFGKYESLDYENDQKFIPRMPTRGPLPPGRKNDIYFNLTLPKGPRPAGGWPVAIYAHGTSATKETGLFAVAGRMALQGIATIGINGVGHGFGANGLLNVATKTATFTLPSGGRGINQDGNTTIAATEGLFASGQVLVNRTDGDRQTVVDLIYLVRAIDAGVDVDGDRVPDLDASRIFCFGNSMGGFVSTLLLAVEPAVRFGGIAAAGGPHITVGRLAGDRPLVSATLAARQPPLLNAPTPASLLGFNENIPFRDQAPLINTVPGAMEIQEFFERIEWVNGSADPNAFAPYIRRRPLERMPVKGVIVQFARGDRTVPNLATSALLRAGEIKDRATFYHYELVYPTFDAAEMTALAKSDPAARTRAMNPHVFLSNLTNPPAGPAPKSAAIAFANRDRALDQLATFFITDGHWTVDPDGPRADWETPFLGELPETLNPVQ
jgi:fermentation-respiration switch protein FrsA (DUF1100 family)